MPDTWTYLDDERNRFRHSPVGHRVLGQICTYDGETDEGSTWNDLGVYKSVDDFIGDLDEEVTESAAIT